MTRLSQRMITTFCTSVYASGMQSWTALSDSSDDTVRVTTKKNTAPGQPNGVILTAVSTTLLVRQKLKHLVMGERKEDSDISTCMRNPTRTGCKQLLPQRGSPAPREQHPPLRWQHRGVRCNRRRRRAGGDEQRGPILHSPPPDRFVISPATRQPNVGTSSGGDGHATVGCLLTVGMQVLATAVPSAKLNLSSVTAIDNHLCNTIQLVRAVLAGGTATAEPSAVAPDQ
ncbi:hypothetical protein B296_00009437 [Ensete ventricosum]|uniref:HD-Zip IV C-terminal domain-containing protein n=1 Tax=Ensete ventricosum TaxID=4639 RepID=A0A426ZL36_ENSVE|nr:hypothetical protein B296_00009437 [Ensete ventricosum]